MQGVIQKYTDSSISSTINLPEDIALETVADIYITAYKEGLKGVTVYREGSREGILQTEGQGDKQEAPAVEVPNYMGPDGFLHRRRRPAVTAGITERINTGEGKIYVTINEDEYGICEVFSTIGKSGGNAAAQSEAISRLISLVLSSGVDPQEVISELKGHFRPQSGMGERRVDPVHAGCHWQGRWSAICSGRQANSPMPLLPRAYRPIPLKAASRRR